MIDPLKLVETKNGESYDGILTGADTYMNLRLKDVIVTTAVGVYHKHPTAYIRGNNIKCIQLQPEIIQTHLENIRIKCKSKYK